MGLVATTWVPMGAQVPILSPTDQPNPPQGRQKGFGETQNLKIFQLTLNSLTSLKTASLIGKGPWGGVNRGYPVFRPETPAMG